MRPLNDLKEELSISYLFISHDLNVVAYMSDIIAVMYLGSIVECGPKEQILKTPLHPYTKALLHTIPQISEKKIVIRGKEDRLLVFLATMIQVSKDMELDITIIIDE